MSMFNSLSKAHSCHCAARLSAMFLGALGVAAPVHAAVDILIQGNPTVTPSALAGGPVTVSYVVRNNGDQVAAATKTKIQIFTPLGTQYSVQDFSIAALGAGQQRTESHTLTLRADSWTGLWEVGFRLDTEVVLPESVTVNNTTAVRPKFKLTATRPDLTFARGSESVYSGYQPRVCPAAYGTRLYLGFDIKNDSLAAAPASKTRVEIRDRSNNIHVQEEVNTPAIPAGATVPFIYSTLLPATGTAGNWNVFLVLDDLGAVTEATEFNNSISSFYFPVTAAGTVPGPCPITAGCANPRSEGTQFVMELSGLAGTAVTIQTSTNLTSWTTLATPSLTNGVNRYSTALTAGRRYFRVR